MNIKRMSIVTNDGKKIYSICERHGASDPENSGKCSVCGSKTTKHREERELEEFNIAIFTNEEVENAIKEFNLFKQRKGKTWDKGIVFSRTFISDFIDLYFGESDDGIFIEFDGFKGTNKNVTDKLKKLFSVLEYHDTFRQRGISLDSFGDVIIINKFDY